jgi:hypothetical protein
MVQPISSSRRIDWMLLFPFTRASELHWQVFMILPLAALGQENTTGEGAFRIED